MGTHAVKLLAHRFCADVKGRGCLEQQLSIWFYALYASARSVLKSYRLTETLLCILMWSATSLLSRCAS